MTEWKTKFRGKSPNPAHADVSIELAELIDERGNDAGIISVNAETYQDGWETCWTGNAEVCFRSSLSEEFDVIATSDSKLKDTQHLRNRKVAKTLIKKYTKIAKEIEIECRQAEADV